MLINEVMKHKKGSEFKIQDLPFIINSYIDVIEKYIGHCILETEKQKMFGLILGYYDVNRSISQGEIEYIIDHINFSVAIPHGVSSQPFNPYLYPPRG